MSAEAKAYVWRSSPYSGSRLVIHLAIADVVNDTYGNEFWMPVAGLAAKARCSRSTALDALAQMVKDGHLEVLKKGGGADGATRYRFLFPAGPQQQSLGLDPVQNPDPPRPNTGGPPVQNLDPELKDITQTTTRPPTAGRRDELFEAIADACGLDYHDLTRSERGRINRACSELRQLQRVPMPSAIAEFARRWRRQYGARVAVTPNTIAANWSRIMASKAPSDAQRDADNGVV